MQTRRIVCQPVVACRLPLSLYSIPPRPIFPWRHSRDISTGHAHLTLYMISPSVRYDKMPLLQLKIKSHVGILILFHYWQKSTARVHSLHGRWCIQKALSPDTCWNIPTSCICKGPGECNTNPPADPAGVRYACYFKSTMNSRGPFTTR